MRHETRDFVRSFHNNPHLQIRYVGNMVMTHAAVTDEIMEVEGTQGDRLTPEEKLKTAEAVVQILSAFNTLFKEWRDVDPSYARIVDDIISGSMDSDG